MALRAEEGVLLQQLAGLIADDATWAATCYTIRNKNQQLVKLQLNDAQRDVGRREKEQLAREGKARQYILKARQAGFTTYQQMRSLKLTSTTPAVDALTIADKQKRTDKVYQITERAIKHFPKALLPKMGNRRSKEVSFPDLESNFFTDTAGGGDPARGLTLARLHCSEFAYFEEPRAVLSAAVPSLVPNNSVVVLETTASMYDDEAHDFWRESELGQTGYEAIFYPWWQADPQGYRRPLLEPDELRPLSEEEQLLVTRQGLDLEQIKWRRETMREHGLAYFLREYAEDPETCWMAAGTLYYDAAMLKILFTKAPSPIATELGNKLEIFARNLPPGDRMVIGSDTSEGGAKDRFTWVARSFRHGRLMSAYASAQTTPEDFADDLNKYARQFNFPVLCIEKNMHGVTVLRRLRDVHKYPLERLYHRMSYEQNTAAPTRVLGWYTGPESKAQMLDQGRQVFLSAAAGTISVPPKGVIKDAFAVRYDKEGKVKLNGRDLFVAETLCRVAHDYPLIPLGNQLPPTVIG